MRILPLIIASALLPLGCDRKASTSTSTQTAASSQLRLGESSVTSNDLTVTNGNVVLTEGRPGIAFGFVTLPGQSKEFTYFLVFNHSFPDGGVSTESSGDDLAANASHTIRSFGNECQAEYHAKLNADTRSIEAERTLVAGMPYDTASGKVFLIDMKESPPAVTQLKLKQILPSEIPNLETPDAAEQFGAEVLIQLRKADKTMDAFCKHIEQAGQ